MKLSDIIAWIRARLELSTIISIVTAAVALIGRCFYDAYYAFFSIPGETIEPPPSQCIVIAVVAGLFTLLLISMVYRSQDAPIEGFWRTAVENVPLAVVLLLVTIVVLDLYWSNVDSASSWLSSLVNTKDLASRNQVLTHKVVSSLRLLIVLVPVPVAVLISAAASVLDLSFSRFLMGAAPGVRIGAVCLYLLLLLRVCCLCGRAEAFTQFTGLLAEPKVEVSFTDGSVFEPTERLFIVAESSTLLVFSGKASDPSATVRSWIVPLASIKSMKAESDPPRWDVFLKFFRK